MFKFAVAILPNEGVIGQSDLTRLNDAPNRLIGRVEPQLVLPEQPPVAFAQVLIVLFGLVLQGQQHPAHGTSVAQVDEPFTSVLVVRCIVDSGRRVDQSLSDHYTGLVIAHHDCDTRPLSDGSVFSHGVHVVPNASGRQVARRQPIQVVREIHPEEVFGRIFVDDKVVSFVLERGVVHVGILLLALHWGNTVIYLNCITSGHVWSRTTPTRDGVPGYPRHPVGCHGLFSLFTVRGWRSTNPGTLHRSAIRSRSR